MLLPRTQPRVFVRLLISNKFFDTKSVLFALYMQYSPPFHMCRRTFQCLTALYWFKLQIKRVHNKSIRWVQLLLDFVDLNKTMQLSAFMYSNYMYQGFKGIMHFQKIIDNWNYCSAGKKNRSDCPGQVNFDVGQVKIEVWWPNGQVKLV